jgi:hypothetical protein
MVSSELPGDLWDRAQLWWSPQYTIASWLTTLGAITIITISPGAAEQDLRLRMYVCM